MSQDSNRNRQAANEFVGLPTGSAIGINFAALFTGALIAVWAGGIGTAFPVLFAAAVIITTLLVQHRGIFLTVATAPLLFLGAVVTIGLLLGWDQLAGAGASSRAAQLMVLYPLIEFFPWLLGVTLVAALIGFGRIQLIKRHNKAVAAREARDRTRAAASNAKSTSQGRRARERAAGRGSARSVSVQELIRRERASGASTSKEPRSPRLSSDLYSD